MKKRISLFFVLACLVVTGCRHFHRRDLSISFSDSERYYSMKARFNDDHTRAVEHYIDRVMGDASNMSFVNTRIDGQISFNDHTSFYIKKYDGYLQIKFDKYRNSANSYEKVQHLCQGIKRLLTERGPG